VEPVLISAHGLPSDLSRISRLLIRSPVLSAEPAGPAAEWMQFSATVDFLKFCCLILQAIRTKKGSVHEKKV
jgi:hypothetical protein